MSSLLSILTSTSPIPLTSGKAESPTLPNISSLPGTLQRRKTLAFFLSGRSGQACVEGRKQTRSWGTDRPADSLVPGRSSVCNVPPRAGGWTSKGGRQIEITLAKPHNMSRAYVQNISLYMQYICMYNIYVPYNI